MQSVAELKFGSADVPDKKKQKVDYELHRPTAARLITACRCYLKSRTGSYSAVTSNLLECSVSHVIERLSITLRQTANGKNDSETSAVCLQLSVQ